MQKAAITAEGPFFTHQPGHFRRGDGSAEEVALHLVALQRTQQFELIESFHSLSNHLKLQAVCKSYNGPGNRLVRRFSLKGA